MPEQDLIAELRWRGLIHQVTDEPALAKQLASGPQTVYIGFDPTATSLHVGSMMQLMMLRRFQQFGHRPIALVGGATGMIGDPSGKSEERNLLTAEQLQENIAGVREQISRFLSFDGDNAAILLNNFDWMKDFSYLDFLRDVGKNFPVGAMMGKESVRARLGSEAGLSYTEFSYMLLQAYDFVHLCKEYDCQIQAGGSDQWGNVTAGIDLTRRMLGRQVFGITAPLLTTSDGRKMGKTESGAVWLDRDRTSPYAFYQYWINVNDEDVMRCIAYLTEIPRDEYDSLAESTQSDPGRRVAQKRLAEWMTQFVHGDEGLNAALSASKILFGGEIERMDDQALVEIFADVPSQELSRDLLSGEGFWIVEAFQQAGLAKSGGEARRAIKDGGAYVNNQRVSDMDQRLTESDLASESVMVLRKGKRNYALLRFTGR
ncbi:tyrosine--tRNA ligase [Roseiconus nitratireducens]|uniref:Tyrosine--tRNA ligase n=1 Tax=Roseiconus nitratireducens TaxID=2605748 RepID=A0A5M6D6R6_9BACT|nr:tyrosine--tRNA ligase [Roseiconus nitratireducens]KAA5543211.1 tyrosine--tRNA ligase [Roseiconus nitratireducens]